MSKKTLLTFSLILCILTIGSATAYSSGYPAAAIGTFTGSNGSTSRVDYVVLAKFASGASGFTFAEAESYSEMVVTAVSSLMSSLGDGALTPTTFTPSQLAAAGIADGDAARTLVANNWAAAGMEIYVFLDIKKAPAVTAASGPNIRMDIYASGLMGSAEIYLASIEAPIQYFSILGSL